MVVVYEYATAGRAEVDGVLSKRSARTDPEKVETAQGDKASTILAFISKALPSVIRKSLWQASPPSADTIVHSPVSLQLLALPQ